MIEKVYLRHKPLVALLLTVILLSVFIFAVRLNVGAQTIDETNPELEFTMINSDIMTEYGDDLYTSEGQYDHNASTGEYNLKTNAYVAWYTRDDLAYAYKEYNVSNKAGDYIDAQITVTKTTSVEGTGLDGNASAGLMFRAGLEPSAAEIFLHFRSGRLQVVYRSLAGILLDLKDLGGHGQDQAEGGAQSAQNNDSKNNVSHLSVPPYQIFRPEKPMKARAIRPAVTRAMGKPSKDLG